MLGGTAAVFAGCTDTPRTTVAIYIWVLGYGVVGGFVCIYGMIPPSPRIKTFSSAFSPRAYHTTRSQSPTRNSCTNNLPLHLPPPPAISRHQRSCTTIAPACPPPPTLRRASKQRRRKQGFPSYFFNFFLVISWVPVCCYFHSLIFISLGNSLFSFSSLPPLYNTILYSTKGNSRGYIELELVPLLRSVPIIPRHSLLSANG